MFRSNFLLFLAATGFLPLTFADAPGPPPIQLLHRVYHPALPDVPFSPKASIVLSSSGPRLSASLSPAGPPSTDFHHFALALDALSANYKDALYQVALEHPGDSSNNHWDISSVKACHLAQSFSESITLHVTPDGVPYTLDYFVGPIPHNGACPKKKAASSSDSLVLGPISNSTVTIHAPTFPPLPQLRTPPPLTPEGKPLEPVPEKSFLQKYWIYIAVAVVALVLSPAPAEEEQGDSGRKR